DDPPRRERERPAARVRGRSARDGGAARGGRGGGPGRLRGGPAPDGVLSPGGAAGSPPLRRGRGPRGGGRRTGPRGGGERRGGPRVLVEMEEGVAGCGAGADGVAARRELLTFQAQELARVAPQPDESDELEREREILRHAERLRTAAAEAENVLYASDGAVL